MLFLVKEYTGDYDIGFYHNGNIVGKIVVSDQFVQPELFFDVDDSEFKRTAYTLTYGLVFFNEGILGAELANYVNSVFLPISSNNKKLFVLLQTGSSSKSIKSDGELLSKLGHAKYTKLASKYGGAHAYLLTLTHFIAAGRKLQFDYYKCTETGQVILAQKINEYIVTQESAPTKEIFIDRIKSAYTIC